MGFHFNDISKHKGESMDNLNLSGILAYLFIESLELLACSKYLDI